LAQAQEVLGRVPCNLAHNVTVVDRSGDVVTAYLSPDREPVFTRPQSFDAFDEGLHEESLAEGSVA
jgi:predicted choloylglycine hydrolase